MKRAFYVLNFSTWSILMFLRNFFQLRFVKRKQWKPLSAKKRATNFLSNETRLLHYNLISDCLLLVIADSHRLDEIAKPTFIISIERHVIVCAVLVFG